jgi:membrane peptidoglycan carboxypeptidase
VAKGGLEVRTTLDLNLQNEVQQNVSDEVIG